MLAAQGWGENDRGVSYTFGPDSVTEFLQKHDLDLICRAHQARACLLVPPTRCGCLLLWLQPARSKLRRMLGTRPPQLQEIGDFHDGLVAVPSRKSCLSHRPFRQVVEEGYEFFARRQLVTIFSAPNYCGEFDNAGAMMSVDDTLMCSFQVRCSKTAAVQLPQCATWAVRSSLLEAQRQDCEQIVHAQTACR